MDPVIIQILARRNDLTSTFSLTALVGPLPLGMNLTSRALPHLQVSRRTVTWKILFGVMQG